MLLISKCICYQQNINFGASGIIAERVAAGKSTADVATNPRAVSTVSYPFPKFLWAANRPLIPKKPNPGFAMARHCPLFLYNILYG
jgi:hypothetical protein